MIKEHLREVWSQKENTLLTVQLSENQQEPSK